MGPAWNKLIGPKFTDSTNAVDHRFHYPQSQLLTKRPGSSQDKFGVQNGLTEQMQGLTGGSKDGVLQTQKWLFGGSEGGYNQLGAMISDASMFGDSWLLDRGDHAKQVKRSINALLIPMAWQYPPDIVMPFIAESDAACNQDSS
ncbi:hypothetical protein ACHAP5_011855 [Fusarium lateritium]